MLHLHVALADPTRSTCEAVKVAKKIAGMGVGVFASANTTLSGTVSAAMAAKKAGVGVIPGYRCPKSDLILLAGTEAAWSHLIRLSSNVDTHDPPDGLWAIIPGDGELASLSRTDPARCADRVRRLRETWGGRLSFELTPDSQDAASAARAMGVASIAGNSVRHLTPGDAFALEVYLAIGAGKTLKDFDRPRIDTTDRWLCDERWWRERVRDGADDAIRRSHEVADACEFRIKPPSRPYMPKAHWTTTPDQTLAELSQTGLAARGLHDSAEHRDRLAYELEMIRRLGWSDYFLVVEEFVRWSKDRDIPVGPGRGSGVGSLVAYVLRITGLDPIAHGLLFERFLNPERVSIPDFDIDFSDTKRDRVIGHVEELYGSDCMSQIATINRLQTKAAIKDVARVLGYGFAEVNAITAVIPPLYNGDIDTAIGDYPELLHLAGKRPLGAHLLPVARALHKLPKSYGVHAAGVVIADRPIIQVAPLMEVEGRRVVQFDKDEAEEAGLVKFDFLGLKTLRDIQRTEELAGVSIDPEKLTLDDPKVMALFDSGDTERVFQFESSQFRRLLKDIRPRVFGDLVAAVSLYRPGPKESGMLAEFIKRRVGHGSSIEMDSRLDALLAETSGVLVYQEQIMQAARILAGYTLGGADLLRRAMGKKKPEEMEKERAKFVAGATSNGMTDDQAAATFDYIEKFAGYGFNKSHAAAYALIAWATAYCKVYHRVAYAAANIESHADDPKKLAATIRWVRSQGVRVLCPSVNGPLDHCDVEGDAVRLGVNVIPNIGDAIVGAIMSARSDRLFVGIDDFFSRVGASHLSQAVMVQLARAGAFDDLGEHRAAAVARAAELASRKLRAIPADRFAFDIPFVTAKRADIPDEWSRAHLLAEEHVALGVYVSGHPADVFEGESLGLSLIEDQMAWGDDGVHLVGGMIAGLLVHIPRAKTPGEAGKRPLGFFQIEGPGGRSVDVVAYGDAWQEIRAWVKDGALVVIAGRVKRAHPTAIPGLIVLSRRDDPQELPVRIAQPGRMTITYRKPVTDHQRRELAKIQSTWPGSMPVTIVYPNARGVMMHEDVDGGVLFWRRADIQRELVDAEVEIVVETPDCRDSDAE